jgi:hypothetical protein
MKTTMHPPRKMKKEALSIDGNMNIMALTINNTEMATPIAFAFDNLPSTYMISEISSL